jgi:hypothetical protein
MRSVTMRLRAADFSASMTAVGRWFEANRYEPIRYKYDHNEHAVLVTVDLATELAAEAFATRFDSVHHSSPQSILSTARADPPRNRQKAPRLKAFGPIVTRTRIWNTRYRRVYCDGSLFGSKHIG